VENDPPKAEGPSSGRETRGGDAGSESGETGVVDRPMRIGSMVDVFDCEDSLNHPRPVHARTQEVIMKPTHVEAERLNARAILTACHIALGQDFYTLSTAQVGDLLAYADRVKYQRPRHAKGSRARYFHEMLQRRGRAK
jgi:hypothetical protein